MSLLEAIALEKAGKTHLGKCVTCAWYAGLTEADKETFDEFAAVVLAGKAPMSILHRACARNEENPLKISRTSFAEHVKDPDHHRVS